MKTEMILKEIAAKGEITERQISLLKRRSNKVQKDLYDYANVRVSADQGANYLPVYEICGLEYIANSRRGKIYVIG